MEPRRRNPLRRYPTAVCISVLHSGLTQSKTRALNSPGVGIASKYELIESRAVRTILRLTGVLNNKENIVSIPAIEEASTLVNLVAYKNEKREGQWVRAVQRSRLGLGESEMQHADANRRRVAA